jgi:hypothetical protein
VEELIIGEVTVREVFVSSSHSRSRGIYQEWERRRKEAVLRCDLWSLKQNVLNCGIDDMHLSVKVEKQIYHHIYGVYIYGLKDLFLNSVKNRSSRVWFLNEQFYRFCGLIYIIAFQV